jgi:hypothetical protein
MFAVLDSFVEHARRGAHGFFEAGQVEFGIDNMRAQVDRTQIANSCFFERSVEQNFCAQVAAVDDACVALRRAHIRRIFPRDPRVAGFEKARQHFAPEFRGGDALEKLYLARVCFAFVFGIPRFESLANQVVQIGNFVGAEERPVGGALYALHEEIGNPVGRVHVMRAAPVIAGVFAQVQKLFDVEMPRFEIRADRTLAFAALINGDGGVVHYFQERNYALALAMRALDV